VYSLFSTAAIKMDMLPADPTLWTEEQVGEFLELNGLATVKGKFIGCY
jgi:hypothetical protein